jgi:hypothetical protein
MTGPAELTFRVAARQRRKIITNAFSFVFTIDIIVIYGIMPWIYGSVIFWGLMCLILGIVAWILLYVTLMYGGAYTECTPSGIRTRGWGITRTCAWDQVSSINIVHVRKANVLEPTMSQLFRITTIRGAHFNLGAPLTAPRNQDPEFLDKYDQIVAYGKRISGKRVA